MFLDEFVPLSILEILPDHLADKFSESGLCDPAEFFPGLGWIPEQSLYLRRPKIAWIDADNDAGGEFV